MKRLFFALPCPETCRQSVLEWRQNNLGLLKPNWVAPDNLHITLAFIGAVEDDRVNSLVAIGNAVQGRRFRMVLDRTGEFGGGKYVWIGPSNPPRALTDLVEALNRQLADNGYPIDQRPYRPHLTLARQAPPHGLPEAPNGIDFPAAAFSLYESIPIKGNIHYHPIKEWKLTPPAP